MWLKRLQMFYWFRENRCGHEDYALVLLPSVMIQTLTRLTFC